MLSCTKLSLMALKEASAVVAAASIALKSKKNWGAFFGGIWWKEPCSRYQV
jgi:hypothetical protein